MLTRTATTAAGVSGDSTSSRRGEAASRTRAEASSMRAWAIVESRLSNPGRSVSSAMVTRPAIVLLLGGGGLEGGHDGVREWASGGDLETLFLRPGPHVLRRRLGRDDRLTGVDDRLGRLDRNRGGAGLVPLLAAGEVDPEVLPQVGLGEHDPRVGGRRGLATADLAPAGGRLDDGVLLGDHHVAGNNRSGHVRVLLGTTAVAGLDRLDRPVAGQGRHVDHIAAPIDLEGRAVPAEEAKGVATGGVVALDEGRRVPVVDQARPRKPGRDLPQLQPAADPGVVVPDVRAPPV